MAAVLRATTSFAYIDASGLTRIITPGDLVGSTDPVVKGREQHFETVEVAAGRFAGVEDATAEPGKPRQRGRPPKDAHKPAPTGEESRREEPV